MTDEEILTLIREQTIGEEIFDEIDRVYFPHYGLYHRKNRKVAEVFCTSCYETFEQTTARAIHNEYGECSCCKSEIKYLADGKGRKHIRDARNFAIISDISQQELSIRCIRIERRFLNPDAGPYFGEISNAIFENYVEEPVRYYLKKGEKPVKFVKRHYYFEDPYWARMKTATEPEFIHSCFGMSDNSYTIFGLESTERTDFKYLFQAADLSISQAPNIIQLLAEYAAHPQIEYLFKAGFGKIVNAKLNKSMCGVRLNWKSNNLKKILGLNAHEIDLMCSCTASELSAYKHFRKIDKKSTVDEIATAVIGRSGIGSYIQRDFMTEMIEKYGESIRSIMKYARTPNEIRDWSDYIRQCRILNYDISDSSVRKPKRLQEAHQRCTELITEKENHEINEMIMSRAKELADWLGYTDEERGYTVVIPQSVSDIIREGKDLSHCVGGYAKRHAEGILNIIFIREVGKEETSFYTAEISQEGKIVQCRGYKNNCANNPKPESVIQFEEEYQKYIYERFKELHSRKRRRRAKKEEKSA